VRVDVVALGACRVHVMSVVRGLVSESGPVRAAVSEVRPEAVALSIGREELEGLRAHAGEEVPADNLEEEVYVRGLSRFGDVRKPPPCFVEALAASTERGIPVHPLDMDNEQYTNTYVATVSTADILLSNARQRKLRGWESKAQTPADLVLEWDALVNASAGYRKLQSEREAFLARRIRQLASRYGTFLALVEVERAKGVLDRLA
jgi:pheromone shutdown protein TraB